MVVCPLHDLIRRYHVRRMQPLSYCIAMENKWVTVTISELTRVAENKAAVDLGSDAQSLRFLVFGIPP